MSVKRPTEVSPEQLWQKIAGVAKRAGSEVVEKTLWLHYAAQQPQTPVWAKTVMYGALAYFIMPMDAIPDMIPGAGFTDDLGALATAIATVSIYINDDVKTRAQQKIRRWFGDPAAAEVDPNSPQQYDLLEAKEQD